MEISMTHEPDSSQNIDSIETCYQFLNVFTSAIGPFPKYTRAGF